MKQFRYLSILSIVALIMTSCNEREVEVFGPSHEIYFDKFFINALYPGTEQADSTEVSFFFSGDDVKYITADLIVHLSGRELTKDLDFRLRAVESESTAIPAEYDLSETFKFRAREMLPGAKSITDTIHVKMLRSSRLKDFPEGVKLTVEVVPNEQVRGGQFERSRAKIILTERSVRPIWWTTEVEEYLLGPFSEKKYQLFLKNVKDAITLNEAMIKDQPDQAIKLVREFKKWLAKQDPKILEENGNEMIVNV